VSGVAVSHEHLAVSKPEFDFPHRLYLIAHSYTGTSSLFGLAPCGVCPARGITAPAVRSYRTFSPLPLASPPRRYIFCGTFRPAGLNRPSRTLSGTLLCGVRTFLSPRPKTLKAAVRSGCLPHHSIRCFRRLFIQPPTPSPSTFLRSRPNRRC
jgi:hypothetical protein